MLNQIEQQYINTLNYFNLKLKNQNCVLFTNKCNYSSNKKVF